MDIMETDRITALAWLWVAGWAVLGWIPVDLWLHRHGHPYLTTQMRIWMHDPRFGWAAPTLFSGEPEWPSYPDALRCHCRCGGSAGGYPSVSRRVASTGWKDSSGIFAGSRPPLRVGAGVESGSFGKVADDPDFDAEGGFRRQPWNPLERRRGLHRRDERFVSGQEGDFPASEDIQSRALWQFRVRHSGSARKVHGSAPLSGVLHRGLFVERILLGDGLQSI